MPKIFRKITRAFIPTRLSTQVRELYSSTVMMNFAVSLVNIFEPVFIFGLFIKNHDLGASLSYLLYFYLAVYIPYFFFVPLGAKFAKRFGYEYSIALSTIFLIGIYLFLYFGERSVWYLALAAVSYVLQKAFYWPAYHFNFCRFSHGSDRGREISNLSALISLVFILGPLVGGWLLELYDFSVLFLVASILILASNVPMLLTKEKFKPTKFPYLAAIKRVFARQNRRFFWASIGYGEELILLVIWPVFIYRVVTDYLQLGVLTSLATAVTTVIFLFIGRFADKMNRRGIIRISGIFYALSWFLRLLSRSILGVFLLDSFSRVAKQAISIPITAMVYDEARESSVSEVIVFYEMALVAGKIIAMVLCLILLQFFAPGWNAMFMLAGLMTFLYLLF